MPSAASRDGPPVAGASQILGCDFSGTELRKAIVFPSGDQRGELSPLVWSEIFVSGPPGATWQSTLLYGALFRLFCYATFELTSMSMLKHWTWLVVIVDVTRGAFVTAVSSTAGLLIANPLTPRI